MNTTQKIIKYCAIAFAIFLSISIIGGIVSALTFIPAIMISDDNVGKMNTYSVDSGVKGLELDLGVAQLEIKSGNKFEVQSNHKRLKLDQKDGVLKIWESNSARGWLSKDVKVILTIPEEYKFEKAEISAGAGTMKIDSLQADKLTLDLGAGEVTINNLVANNSAKIEGGAGELVIYGGTLSDLDFDIGIGEADLETRLIGNCEIDYGIGQLDLTLIGEPEDYCIILDKGLGDATIDGKKMHDDGVYGMGDSRIDIDGGIGELKINFVSTAIGER